MEGGLGTEPSYDYGRFGSSGEEFKQLPMDGEVSYPQYPGNTLHADMIGNGSQNLPIPASPYRPVPHHTQSIPDLVPALGLLQVMNYVPGDVSSDDGSRANSCQGVAVLPPVLESPAAGQWSIYGPEDGFNNPWPPLRTKSRSGLGISNERDALPTSGNILATSYTDAEPTSAQAQEGWTASLRSNIRNVFQAVVRGGNTPPQDNLTRAPERMASQRTSAQVPTVSQPTSPEHVVDLDLFADYVDADLPDANDASQEHSHEPGCLCEWLKQRQQPTSQAEVQDTDTKVLSPALFESQGLGAPSPTSMYAHSPAKDPSDAPFELPPIPMSRTGSASSLQQAIWRKQLRRGRSKKVSASRHTPLDRMYSSSSCSVGSEMSRTASRASSSASLGGPLTDQERVAHRMLAERRKRVLAAHRVAAKESLRRPSVRLGSRRHPKGVGKKVYNKSPLVEVSLP